MGAVIEKTTAINQNILSKPRRKTKAKIKPSTVAIYAGVFVLLVAMISIGYHEPTQKTPVANVTNVNTNTSELVEQTSVDKVIASGVAAGVAKIADLPIADDVMNMAVSTQVKSELSQLDSAEVSKPQLVETTSSNRSVTEYTAIAGDTVDTVAAKFGVSAQTIKWANNLTSVSLSEGKVLKILPVDGVLYTVKSTDTVDSISEKYSVDKTRIVVFNDLEVSGLTAGQQIVLPNGVLPNTERPGYVAPVTNSYSSSFGLAYGYSGGDVKFLNTPPVMSEAVRAYIPHLGSLYERSDNNKMTLGNCTWWAWERRKALGKELPLFYGNAGSWAYTLGSQFGVDKNPRPGDVFESYGHVGIVERLNYDANGTVVSLTTSEMNWGYVNYSVVERTIPAANFANFNYIH